MSKNTSGKNVSLTPEMEKFIQDKIDAGFYGTASEVIREGLRLLKHQDELREAQLDELRGEIQKGRDDIKNGNIDTVDNVRIRLKNARKTSK